jgi:hypothetical protein
MSSSVGQQFNKVTVSYYSEDDFVEMEHFAEYHYYEDYDSNKIYQKTQFEYDYGHGKHIYSYALHRLISYEDQDNELNYVVADEELDEDKSKQLEKYCQCRVCTSKWYDIGAYFTCRCCIGCLKSPFPQQYQINAARKYMVANKILE